jgi:hypothetical protein
MALNVLAVVATATDLPRLASSEELARIGDVPGVAMRTLTDATAQRVAHRLSLEEFDLLLWIGHGEGGSLLTQEGRIDPQWLATQLSSRRVRTAVIATCESGVRPEGGLQAAQSFADALPAAGIDTITMATKVSDRAAIEYDVELVRQLASGATLRAAHQVALNRALEYGGVQAPQLTPRDHGRRTEQNVADARFQTTDMLLQGMDRKMDRLDGKLDDIERRQDRFEQRLERVEERLRAIATPPGYSRAFLAGAAAVMTVMLFLLVFVTWRLL